MKLASQLRPRPLRCSFCGKTDGEVSKLIAGPRVHICDVCVGVCNRILEATPETFSGWDAMTDEQLLECTFACRCHSRGDTRHSADPN